jgi:hypothetical protein
MNKKTIDMVAIPNRKANAQQLTCFASFIASATSAVLVMIVACLLPVMCAPVAAVCWTSMLLEAISICLGFIAYWIKTKAL